MPSNDTDIVSYIMSHTFYGCISFKNIDLGGLTVISGSFALYNTFFGCRSLTVKDLSGLTTRNVSYEMSSVFQYYTSLAIL